MTLNEKDKSEHGDIIIYQPDQTSSKLEVRIEDETVWLTQAQMIELFDSTKQNVSLHINNIFREKELDLDSTVKENLTVQIEGNRKIHRKLKLYNLDIIISVGYRVKSLRGTQFRIWATQVLRNYLLKGFAINQRIENIEKKVYEHDRQIESLVMQALPPKEGIFYDGQIFDAYEKVVSFVKSAKKSIILIDNYIDETVLTLLTKRKKGVKTTIYTQNLTAQLKLDIKKHNSQYDPIEVIKFEKSHDRFLIIDNSTVYHIGASLKDVGKKWFAFSKIELDPKEMIEKLK
jgi:hypothetical protein